MFKRKQALLRCELKDNLVQHNGHWLIAMKIQSVDLDNKDDLDKEATLDIFRKVLGSLGSNAQTIYRKTPIDFSAHSIKLESNILSFGHRRLQEYGESYRDYLSEVTRNKLDKVNYLIIKTDRRCSYEEGKSYLQGVYRTVKQTFENINLSVSQVEGEELEVLYNTPSFVKEEVDYFVYGQEIRRTYVIQDYPRTAYPNWLKPILDFHYPIECTQHIHLCPRDKIIKQLELNIAKIQSTIKLQEENGSVVSSELIVRLEDTEDLLRRLASGEDRIAEVSFYITLSAPDLEILDSRSKELESFLRQCSLTFRTTRKEVNKGLRAILPICSDPLLESYTLDTKSLSTILPFTVQDYTDKGGVVYGLNIEETEVISINRWGMPNPNMIVLGKSGFGKSMFSKLETARQIIDGAKAIIIDHIGEWKEFCTLLGGDYVDDPDGTINWNKHLLVFSGSHKTRALRIIWNYIQNSRLERRVFVLEEFHNVLVEDKVLMLQVIKEIRKHGVAPTLITQNVKDFSRSEEGQMIFDNCSIKVLMRQGENDVEEVQRLFDLSRNEKIFLKTCPIGKGYLVTDLYKTRFKSDCSEREHDILSTNPIDIMRRTKI